jgi:hypothetical protein
MKTFGRIVLVLLFLCAGNLMQVSPAQAAESCHQINAKGVGQDLGNGATVANIIGGGLLQGTTVGNFAITGGAFPLFTLAGTVKFTTHQATLTVTISGIFDVATGKFSATGPVTGATGKLADATGDLVLSGIEKLADGNFVEAVTGNICVDLAP